MLFPLAHISQPAATVMNPIMARLIDTPDRYRAEYLLVQLPTVPRIIAMLLTANTFILNIFARQPPTLCAHCSKSLTMNSPANLPK